MKPIPLVLWGRTLGWERACMHSSSPWLADYIGKLWAGHAWSFVPCLRAPLEYCIRSHSQRFLPVWTLQAFVFVTFCSTLPCNSFDHHLPGWTYFKIPTSSSCLSLEASTSPNCLSLRASSSRNSSSFLTKLSLSGVPFIEFPNSESWKASVTLPFLAHQVDHWDLLLLPSKSFL